MIWVAIQAILGVGEPGPGIRTRPGTIVGNSATREVIYTTPQDYDQIVELLERLLIFSMRLSMGDSIRWYGWH